MAGGIYEQSEWPDSRWDCVTVCDGCHTVVWGTFWDDYDSSARDAYFARNGWRNYCVPGDTEILELCPACAVRALRRGGTRVAAVFMGESANVPNANAIYGRDLARIRRMDQLAAAAGRLIQDEIRELAD